jgi:hypothetical protein
MGLHEDSRLREASSKCKKYQRIRKTSRSESKGKQRILKRLMRYSEISKNNSDVKRLIETSAEKKTTTLT